MTQSPQGRLPDLPIAPRRGQFVMRKDPGMVSIHYVDRSRLAMCWPPRSAPERVSFFTRRREWYVFAVQIPTIRWA